MTAFAGALGRVGPHSAARSHRALMGTTGVLAIAVGAVWISVHARRSASGSGPGTDQDQEPSPRTGTTGVVASGLELGRCFADLDGAVSRRAERGGAPGELHGRAQQVVDVQRAGRHGHRLEGSDPAPRRCRRGQRARRGSPAPRPSAGTAGSPRTSRTPAPLPRDTAGPRRPSRTAAQPEPAAEPRARLPARPPRADAEGVAWAGTSTQRAARAGGWCLLQGHLLHVHVDAGPLHANAGRDAGRQPHASRQASLTAGIAFNRHVLDQPHVAGHVPLLRVDGAGGAGEHVERAEIDALAAHASWLGRQLEHQRLTPGRRDGQQRLAWRTAGAIREDRSRSSTWRRERRYPCAASSRCARSASSIDTNGPTSRSGNGPSTCHANAGRPDLTSRLATAFVSFVAGKPRHPHREPRAGLDGRRLTHHREPRPRRAPRDRRPMRGPRRCRPPPARPRSAPRGPRSGAGRGAPRSRARTSTGATLRMRGRARKRSS